MRADPTSPLVLGTTEGTHVSVAGRRPVCREMDRCDAGEPLGLLPSLPEEGESEVDALHLTEPCLLLGAGAAGH